MRDISFQNLVALTLTFRVHSSSNLTQILAYPIWFPEPFDFRGQPCLQFSSHRKQALDGNQRTLHGLSAVFPTSQSKLVHVSPPFHSLYLYIFTVAVYAQSPPGKLGILTSCDRIYSELEKSLSPGHAAFIRGAR